MLRILGSALIAAVLAGPAHAGVLFECESLLGTACRSVTAKLIIDTGPTDTYRIELPSGFARDVTQPDEIWAAGGHWELSAQWPSKALDLYVDSPYFLGQFVGYETRLFSIITFSSDVSFPGWQITGRWGPSISVPEPGTLAIVALALAAAGLAQRRH